MSSPPEPLPTALRRLSWFNLLTACMTLVPCCFGVYLPFVFHAVLDSHMRRVFQDAPEGSQISFPEVMGLPWAVAYLGQIVFIGIPSMVTAILLRRNPRLGWQLSIALVAVQALLLFANLVALIAWGRDAWRALDWPATGGLFAAEVVLLFTSGILVHRAGRALFKKRTAE